MSESKISQERRKAFVIMPFSPEFDTIYSMFIYDALDQAGIEVFRADDIRSQQNILKDVVASIANSDLIIADLTTLNPNVFYELGIAHTLQKPVILLTQDLDAVPFDLRSYRIISYSTYFTQLPRQREELFKYAIDFLEGKLLFGSPVSDFYSGGPVLLPEPVELSPEMAAGDEMERGFLDHLDDLGSGYRRLSELMNIMNSETITIGRSVERVTVEMNRSNESRSSGTASHIRKIARKLSDEIQSYSEKLKSLNDEYSLINKQTENSLEFVVSFQVEASEGDKDKVFEEVESFLEMKQHAASARDSILSLSEAMRGVPPLERHLNHALRSAGEEVKRTADLIDETIAAVTRAVDVAESAVEHPAVLAAEASLEEGWTERRRAGQ